MHMIRYFSLLFLTALMILASPGLAGAQERQTEKHVDIRLVPEYTDVLPGDVIMIAVEQTIQEGWHTYWRNPGDSGAAPRIDWSAPDGFEFTELRWPVPEKFQNGPLTTHGYKDKAILLQTVNIPRDLPETPFTITANIELLVCEEEICIPEFGTYSLTLNEGKNITNTDYIDAAYNDLPLSVDWDSLYRVDDEGRFVVTTQMVQLNFMRVLGEKIAFGLLPYEWGIVDNSAKPLSRINDMTELKVYKERGQRPLDGLGAIKALITYHDFEGRSGAMEVTAKPDPEWAAASAEEKKETAAAQPGKNIATKAGGQNVKEPEQAQKKTSLLETIKQKIRGLIGQ